MQNCVTAMSMFSSVKYSLREIGDMRDMAIRKARVHDWTVSFLIVIVQILVVSFTCTSIPLSTGTVDMQLKFLVDTPFTVPAQSTAQVNKPVLRYFHR